MVRVWRTLSISLLILRLSLWQNLFRRDIGKHMRQTLQNLKNNNYLRRTEKNLLAALLRKDTGAAVTPDEWAYYNAIYFPQPWDKDDTIKLKQQKREIAIKTMLQTSWVDINGKSIASYYVSPSFVTSAWSDISISVENQNLMMDNIVNDVMKSRESSTSFDINSFQNYNPELEAIMWKMSADMRLKEEANYKPNSIYDFGNDGAGNPTYWPWSLNY